MPTCINIHINMCIYMYVCIYLALKNTLTLFFPDCLKYFHKKVCTCPRNILGDITVLSYAFLSEGPLYPCL